MTTMNDLTRCICLFHDADRARAVVGELENAGVARDTVRVIGDGNTTGEMTGPETLADAGVPERDLSHLQDGLRDGGVIVWLDAPEEQSSAIERIFHKYSADKIDETAPTTEPFAAAPLAATTAATISEGTVIPIAEEALFVGKREVDRGGVRVYRRTVDEPVSEDISLHSEHVVLERRDVNRPATDADLRAGDQAIELVETAEVPVVQKVARVVEEIHVGTVASDRTEVVEDTVRHTEVEVEPVASVETSAHRSFGE